MIDFTMNSAAWQKHTGEIAVLPVGALEQHGDHMPLNTDITNAEESARMIAEHFDAALLPAIPIANSLEHSGFRGSFSLRPETLMRVVTDIAEEAEAQNFRFLIVVTGHGGNFALIPACRDYNRRDRKLKMLHIYPSEFSSFEHFECVGAGVMDIHAGEVEASRYLARGEKFRATPPPRAAAAPDGVPWRRSDLTNFGIGCLNPGGFLGIPDAASEEKGRRLAADYRKNLLAYLEDRIARLRKMPRYCGYGGIALRELVPGDLPDLLELTGKVKWNQLAGEWEFMLETAPQSCVGFAHQGRIVATAGLLPFPDGPAWINLVIVDPEWQGARLAARMLEELMARHGAGRCFKLDATPAGSRVYRKLGFTEEAPLLRLTRIAAPAAGDRPAGVEALDDANFARLLEADAACFHADRSALLKWLRRQSGEIAFQTANGGALLSRPGRLCRHLGPIYAPDAETALKLLDAALFAAGGEAVQLDVPEAQAVFLAGLLKRGFQVLRPFVRMGLNCAQPENLDSTFAIAGPEFG